MFSGTRDAARLQSRLNGGSVSGWSRRSVGPAPVRRIATMIDRRRDRRQWLLSEAQRSVSQADSGLPDVLSIASSKAPVGYRLSPTCFPCAAT
jgi:hypothetical protein